jgi:malonyl-CoA O-methyltransferase
MTAGQRDPDPYTIDGAAVRRAFDRAVAGYDAAAVVQKTVRERLLERLDYVRVSPRTILDAGCGTGHGGVALLKRYRGSRVIALDWAPAMLAAARRRRPLLRRLDPVCGNAAALPLADASIDLVHSNLMLQWCNDLDAVFREFMRVLAPGGLLTFTTFGPDTLTELRRAWRAADGAVHVSRFIDMHDVGDAAVRAGFVEPVLDIDRLCTTYERVRDLMRDLKAIGAHNVTRGRQRGLTSRRRMQAAEDAYEEFRRDGRLPATWEVIYGQGWKPLRARARPAPDGPTRIPVTAIGRRRRDDG